MEKFLKLFEGLSIANKWSQVFLEQFHLTNCKYYKQNEAHFEASILNVNEMRIISKIVKYVPSISIQLELF